MNDPTSLPFDRILLSPPPAPPDFRPPFGPRPGVGLLDEIPVGPPVLPPPASPPPAAKPEPPPAEPAPPAPTPAPKPRWVKDALRDLMRMNPKKRVALAVAGTVVVAAVAINALLSGKNLEPGTEPVSLASAPAAKPESPPEKPAEPAPVFTLNEQPAPKEEGLAPAMPVIPLLSPAGDGAAPARHNIIGEAPPIASPMPPTSAGSSLIVPVGGTEAATPIAPPILPPILPQTAPSTDAKPPLVTLPPVVGLPGPKVEELKKDEDAKVELPKLPQTTLPATLPPSSDATGKPVLPGPDKVEPPAPVTPKAEEPAIGVPTLPPTGPMPAVRLDTPPAPLRLDPPATATPGTMTIEKKPGAVGVLGADATRTDFDIDLHESKAGETYATISRLHYGDARFAEVLRAFNRNLDLARRETVQVPPLYIIRRMMQTGVPPAGGETAPGAIRGVDWSPAPGPGELPTRLRLPAGK